MPLTEYKQIFQCLARPRLDPVLPCCTAMLYWHAVLPRCTLLSLSAQVFQCYGFGGKPPNSPVQHCMPMGGRDQYGSCFGIAGLMQAYRWEGWEGWEG